MLELSWPGRVAVAVPAGSGSPLLATDPVCGRVTPGQVKGGQVTGGQVTEGQVTEDQVTGGQVTDGQVNTVAAVYDARCRRNSQA